MKNSNHDVIIASKNASVEKFKAICELIAKLAKLTTTIIVVWLLLNGIKEIIEGQSPEGIIAISKIISISNLGSVLGYIWGSGVTVLYFFERKGKKRAIKEKNKYQNLYEGKERTSSGLDEYGNTPRGG